MWALPSVIDRCKQRFAAIDDRVNLVQGVGKLAVLRANSIGDYLVSLPALQTLRAATRLPSWCCWGPTGTSASSPAGLARSTAACPCRRPPGCATTGHPPL